MKPYWTNGISTLYLADARDIPLPDQSVHCVVTSPPYWGLRDYGLAQWQGGDAECGHKKPNPSKGKYNGKWDNYDGVNGPWPNNTCGHCGAVNTPAGIGQESYIGEHLDNLVSVFREVWRVLRDDGTVWLNYGDAYAGSGKGRNGDGTLGLIGDKQATNVGSMGGIVQRKRMQELPAKNLMGLPWRVAFALQDDGWIIRSAIIWHKPNPMPESAKDRPTSSYEYIFLLAKQGKYFYDAEAIKTPPKAESEARDARGSTYDGTLPYRMNRPPRGSDKQRGHSRLHAGFNDRWDHMTKNEQSAAGANARDVWTMTPTHSKEKHFATFPGELPRRCILAGTSEKGVCSECGAPWERVIKVDDPNRRLGVGYHDHTDDLVRGQRGIFSADGAPTKKTVGWAPTCACKSFPVPATVLDPFVGSGTTLTVAQSLGRRGVGLELNSKYLDIAVKRITAVPFPMVMA